MAENHLMLLKPGGYEMDSRPQQGIEIARSIVRGLRSQDFLPTIYPVLYGRGIEGGSFHSYMVSALLMLGDRLGYSPVCDSPIFDPLDKLLTSEGSKRPDSVWFERGESEVRVLIEFEKFTSTSLQHKARNLVLMANSHRDEIYLLVLIYWATEIRQIADMQSAIATFRSGFYVNGSHYSPPRCPVLILETKTNYLESQIRIDGFIARQLVVDGENKPQLVLELNR